MSWYKNHIISTLISKFGISFCALGVVIITSKIVGAEGRGNISYALLLIAMAQVFAEFICGSNIINLAPKHKAIDLLIPAYSFSIFIGILMYLGFYLKFWNSAISPALILGNYLAICLSNTHLSIILGRKYINTRNGIQFIAVLILLMLTYVIYWVNGSNNISYYFQILLWSNLISWLISLVFLVKTATKGDFNNFRYQKAIHQLGFWSQLSQLVNLLNTRLAYFVVKRDFGNEVLGVYSNTLNIGEKLKITSHSIAQVQHNRIINNENKPYQQRITMRFFTINLLLSSLQLITVLALPVFFWTWLLGNDFIGLRNMFLWLAPGFLALGLATNFSFYFHAINRFKTVLIVNLITLAAMVITYFAAINTLQFNAILLAFSVGYVLQLLLFMLLYVKNGAAFYLSINSSKVFLKKLIK